MIGDSNDLIVNNTLTIVSFTSGVVDAAATQEEDVVMVEPAVAEPAVAEPAVGDQAVEDQAVEDQAVADQAVAEPAPTQSVRPARRTVGRAEMRNLGNEEVDAGATQRAFAVVVAPPNGRLSGRQAQQKYQRMLHIADLTALHDIGENGGGVRTRRRKTGEGVRPGGAVTRNSPGGRQPAGRFIGGRPTVSSAEGGRALRPAVSPGEPARPARRGRRNQVVQETQESPAPADPAPNGGCPADLFPDDDDDVDGALVEGTPSEGGEGRGGEDEHAGEDVEGDHEGEDGEGEDEDEEGEAFVESAIY